MDPSRFDALARTLSTERSRRGVLKTLGVTMLGAFGLAGARDAAAASRRNNACAKFCAAVFGAGTPAADQCTSDAAHGTGTCVECNANPSNYCNSTCNHASDPDNCGTCGNACSGGDECNAPTCANGTCGTTPANEGGPCTTDGQAGTCQSGACVPNVTCIANGQTCTSSTDTCCTEGYACDDNYCGQPFGCCGNAGAPCTNDCDCCGGELICPSATHVCT